jgi:hypothetical protein
MRKFFSVCLVLSSTLLLAGGALALEKNLVRDTEVYGGQWNASTTCVLSYANFCTGYIFNWTGWGNGDTIGQVFHFADCCEPGSSSGYLTQTIHRQRTDSPPSYGFTGVAAVWNSDVQDCPTGAPLMSQPWLPVQSPGPGFQTLTWGVSVPANAVITFQFATPVAATITGFDSDLGGIAASDGEVSCGTCFPCPRPNHSYYYGITPTTVLCPGSGGVGSNLDPEGAADTDGAAVEWRVQYFITCGPVSVDNDTWGSIKGMYR